VKRKKGALRVMERNGETPASGFTAPKSTKRRKPNVSGVFDDAPTPQQRPRNQPAYIPPAARAPQQVFSPAADPPAGTNPPAGPAGTAVDGAAGGGVMQLDAAPTPTWTPPNATTATSPAELSEPPVAAAVQLQADEVAMTADLDEGTDSPASSLTPSPTSREFDAAVVAAFAAREAELAAQPDVDEGLCFTFPSRDNVRWAELASALVDRAVRHVQSLPGTVTHQAKGRAVEQAKKDVGDARWVVCTRLQAGRQPDLLGRVAAVECALAQL
jgi:hypothetical protein